MELLSGVWSVIANGRKLIASGHSLRLTGGIALENEEGSPLGSPTATTERYSLIWRAFRGGAGMPQNPPKTAPSLPKLHMHLMNWGRSRGNAQAALECSAEGGFWGHFHTDLRHRFPGRVGVFFYPSPHLAFAADSAPAATGQQVAPGLRLSRFCGSGWAPFGPFAGPRGATGAAKSTSRYRYCLL